MKQKYLASVKEKDYYREKIIELVEKINNQDILIKIYIFIKTWIE